MTGGETLFGFLRSPRRWFSNHRDRHAALAAREHALRPEPPRDPLWADFQDAALRADVERLANIGDQVRNGVSIDLFRLTENERIVVDAYLGGNDA